MDEGKINCPHCGKLVEPMESETAAHFLLRKKGPLFRPSEKVGRHNASLP